MTDINNRTMAPTAKIPVPTDNYDAPHALVASLTSLRAMAAAADAALDAVEASVRSQSERLEGLTDRAEAYRARVDELAAEAEGGQEDASRSASTAASAGLPQETAPPLRLELPASYDRAVGRSKHGQDHDAAIIHASALALAREAASAAVRDVLRRDRQLDDGRAALADAWLDRPTAFDEAAECAAAVESMTVPSLRSQTLPVEDEVAWYEAEAADAAEAAAAAAAAASSGAGRSSTGASSEEYEYDDAASVRTGMTGLTLSSRITTTTIGADGSNVGGAVERRRQRQQAQLERRRRQRRREQQAASAASAAGGSAGGEQGGKAAASAAAQAAVEDIFDRASAVRQQVLSGSLPYLADVLHDAYGCENESRPKTVDELVAVSTIPPPSSRSK